MPIRYWLQSNRLSSEILGQISGDKINIKSFTYERQLGGGQCVLHREEAFYSENLPLLLRNCTIYPHELAIWQLDNVKRNTSSLERLLDLNNDKTIVRSDSQIYQHNDLCLIKKLKACQGPCFTRQYNLKVDGRLVATISETTTEESFFRIFTDDPTFASLIRWATQINATHQSTLSDHLHSCYYRSLPSLIERIEHYFASNGVNRRQGVILESVNSVPGAITILCLIYGGYRFLLSAPTQIEDNDQNDDSVQPKFLRYHIRVSSGLYATDADLEDPDCFLQIRENKAFEPGLCADKNSLPKMYLKTSGSMGPAKLVQHSYPQLKANIIACLERLQLNSDDRISISVPIFHMFGFGAAFLPGVFAGASLDFQERSNLLRYLSRERTFNPNIAYLTPSFCNTLLKGRKSDRLYRFTVSAGERMSEHTFHSFESRYGPIINLYGSTELGVISTTSLDLPKALRATTVGRPLADVEYQFAQLPENSKYNTSRELCLKHPNGFESYVDLLGVTHNSVTRSDGGWYKTGDLVQEVDGKYLRILGRCGHSINRNGHLVLFADVEQKIMNFGGVEQVVVVSQDRDDKVKQLVAFCVTENKTTLEGDSIRAMCFQTLPRFAIPDRISVIRSMPLLGNGKINRCLLEEATERNM